MFCNDTLLAFAQNIMLLETPLISDDLITDKADKRVVARSNGTSCIEFSNFLFMLEALYARRPFFLGKKRKTIKEYHFNTPRNSPIAHDSFESITQTNFTFPPFIEKFTTE